MKGYIFIIFLLFTCKGSLLAQNLPSGYFNRTKLGLQPGVDYGDRPSGFQQRGSLVYTVNGYHLSPNVGLGIGIGLSQYQNPGVTSIPVTANVDYYFFKKRSTPYAVSSLGYGFVTNDFLIGGLVSELGIGWRFKSGKKVHLGPEITYRYQSFGYRDYEGYRERLKSIFVGFNIMF